MRILNVGQNYRVVGGSDQYFFSLERLLLERGHEVIPFCAKHRENLPTKWDVYFPDEVNFEGRSLVDGARFIYNSQAERCLEKLLDENRIDVAHLHIYYGKLSSSIIRVFRRRKIPVVQTLHEYKLVCPTYTLNRGGASCFECKGGKYWKCITNRCNRGSLLRSTLAATESYASKLLGSHREVSKFICVSDFQRNLIKEMGGPAEKLVTIPNFTQAVPEEKESGLGSYVLYFGRIERIKGIFTLLDAMSDMPDIPLILVGDGGALEEAKALVSSRNMRHISFLGRRSNRELSSLIEGCRFSVLPSEWPETFGLTIIETFCKGRPVVATSVGGIPEVVSDGLDGILVPPKSSLHLRDAIKHLWKSPKICLEMGKSGARKAASLFGEDAHYRELVKVYKEVTLERIN